MVLAKPEMTLLTIYRRDDSNMRFKRHNAWTPIDACPMVPNQRLAFFHEWRRARPCTISTGITIGILLERTVLFTSCGIIYSKRTSALLLCARSWLLP